MISALITYDLGVISQVRTGEYAVLLKQKGDTPVHKYKPGGSFGELALLYNQPRAASIKCVQAGALFALDRKTFRMVLMAGSAMTQSMPRMSVWMLPGGNTIPSPFAGTAGTAFASPPSERSLTASAVTIVRQSWIRRMESILMRKPR